METGRDVMSHPQKPGYDEMTVGDNGAENDGRNDREGLEEQCRMKTLSLQESLVHRHRRLKLYY